MEIPIYPRSPPHIEYKYPTVWRMIYYSFGFLVFALITAAFVMEYQILLHKDILTTLGLYGAALIVHQLMQFLFAYLELRKIEKADRTCSFKKTVALTIAGYQENPEYLRQCLESCQNLNYPKDKLKIILVIDGNTPDDAYMMEMFKDVFQGEDTGTYVWKGNYHLTDNSRGIKQDFSPKDSTSLRNKGVKIVEELIRTKRCVCLMQQWGGKREVMYTAFRALGDTVDYVQVCDSDTKLDRLSTLEMVKVLEADVRCGGVGGDVRILNPYDSFISFMSSLHYWMAFNIEKACQSYFDCVSCISGPLGMYRNDLLQVFLEDWYSHKLLGTYCTLGDDRHLTNRVLSMGYSTKYTHKSRAFSETPSIYLRWLNQQIRWAKSYFREWLYNAQWWYKHHIWMTYESVVSFIFPFFLTVTVIRLIYSGSLWYVIWLVLFIHIVAIVISLYACWLCGKLIMILVSLYPVLYYTGLLPSKYFAYLTIQKTGWGTSGRKRIIENYVPLVPLIIWAVILLVGLGYSIYMDSTKDWTSPQQQKELYHILYGFITCVTYWVSMAVMYWVWVKRSCRKRSQTFYV